MVKNYIIFIISKFFFFPLIVAQPCDPTAIPTGLTAVYIQGNGVTLRWDPVPSSPGVAIRSIDPAGQVWKQRVYGFEINQFLLSEGTLIPGTYTWQVQASCSEFPPFAVTLPSLPSSFSVPATEECPDVLFDYDGNEYQTVNIGLQCWMKENLKVEHYRNGDSIPTGLDFLAWQHTDQGAMAIFDTLHVNKYIYGLLYNGYAVFDSRGLCPLGWHVPRHLEWIELYQFLGARDGSGGAMKTVGTIEDGAGFWRSPNTGATNSADFNALPAGEREGDGQFYNLGYRAIWASSTLYSVGSPLKWFLYFESDVLERTELYGYKHGLSVRCLKD